MIRVLFWKIYFNVNQKDANTSKNRHNEYFTLLRTFRRLCRKEKLPLFFHISTQSGLDKLGAEIEAP